MKHITVALLSDDTNAPIIHLPERKFPGIVIQGDSLSILYNLIENIATTASREQHASEQADSSNDTITDLVQEAQEMLAGYIRVYEASLHAHSYQLPYVNPVFPR